jgi:hypothetical protein
VSEHLLDGWHAGSGDGGRSVSGGRISGREAAMEGLALRFSEAAWSEKLIGSGFGPQHVQTVDRERLGGASRSRNVLRRREWAQLVSAFCEWII